MSEPDKAENHALARAILRSAATGSLATLGEDGAPFASHVVVATDHAGAPILLFSQLAVHTRNLARDRRASLLLVEDRAEDDPLALARLTLVGTVTPADDAPARRRFLARHAEAEGYAGFADFGFYRFAIARAHLVAGFGRIAGLAPADVLTDTDAAGELLAAEESALAHMNADHADALHLYATRLLGLPAGDWRAIGVDPEGIDLKAGATHGRLAFPEPVLTAGDLRRTLADLAKKARGQGDDPT